MKTTIKIWFSFSLSAIFLSAWSFAASSGSFLTTLWNQKDAVLSLYDSWYSRVYEKFQLTGAGIMKSLNYQSLVCLWVMNNGSFLADMQNELKTLKTNFLNQYNSILTSFFDLEQKKRLYEDSKVNLFSNGSYEKDLAVLSGAYTKLISEQFTNVLNFQNKYLQSVSSFISDYLNYSKKNLDLISKVSSKVSLLQQLDLRFGFLKSNLDLYLLSLGSVSKSPLFSNPLLIKNAALSSLDQTLQKQISAQTKKYKILKSLSGSLALQKDVFLSGFASYFDTTYDEFLWNWYDMASYSLLKSKIDAIHNSYYSGSIYLCTPILSNTSFDSDVSLALKSINQLSGSFSSGALNTWSFSMTWFQKKLNSWFSSIKAKQSDIASQSTTFITTTTKTLLDEYKKANESSANTQVTLSGVVESPISTWFSAPVGFLFTIPFTTNQRHSDIIVLQGLLSSLGYYTWAIDSVYTPLTKSAVYHFQLDAWLLKWYEKRPQTWWWMGPATRAALNAALH